MANLKRQRSWQEEFPRNFLKLFSRARPEQEKPKPDSDERNDYEDASDGDQSIKVGMQSTAEPDCFLPPEFQTSAHSEQGKQVEGDCDHEVSELGDAACDPPPITPPASEPCSPVPPVDSFFKRLGSLFLFSRAEPVEAGRLIQPTDEVQGSKDTEEALTSLEGGKPSQQLEPQEGSHSAAGPDRKSPTQTDLNIKDTELYEEALEEEDEGAAVNHSSTEDEHERRHALACPPVVTHVTYRGLRNIRKMKRSQEVRPHSPISEGEEVPCEVGVDLTFSKAEESASCRMNPAVALESILMHKTSSPDISDHQSNASLHSITEYSNSSVSVKTKEMRSDLSLSALQTHIKARQHSDVKLEPMATVNTSCALENDACRFGNFTSFMSDSSGLDHGQNNDALNSFITESPQTSEMQQCNSDTPTVLNTHSTDINTASDLHTQFTSLDITTNCFQNGQLTKCLPDSKGESQVRKCDAQLPQIVEQMPSLDVETLQQESKRMVDHILTNVLSALKQVQVSEHERKTLSSKELSAENLIFLEAKDSMSGSANLDWTLANPLPVQGNKENLQPVLSVTTPVSQTQGDGCHSTPSSGYESIAGSDTDIQSSMAMSADIISTCGLLSMQDISEEAETSGINGNISNHQDIFFLEMNSKTKEEPVRTDLSSDLLHQYHSTNSNKSHVTHITTVLPDTSAFATEQCDVKEYSSHDCVFQEKNNAGLQCASKDELESNNRNNALDLNLGKTSPISNNANIANQLETCASSENVRHLDFKQPIDTCVVKVRDSFQKEDCQVLSMIQYPGICETASELGNRKCTQKSSNNDSTKDQVLTLLPSQVGYVPDSEVKDVNVLSESHLKLLNVDTADCPACEDSQCFRAVKVFLCSGSDDESQEEDSPMDNNSIGLNLETLGGSLPAFPLPARTNLDLPGTFTIINEEEETDAIFVNDMGPILSPSTRRVKTYPFSLSPIYEEDSGREDTSRDDMLHVPPATEEEERSTEQQASSILSLLQSVSQKLQSSAFSDSETERGGEDQPDDPGHPQQCLRLPWDRYGDDYAFDGEPSSPMVHPLPEIMFLSEDTSKDEKTSSSLSPNQKCSSNEDFEERHCDSTMTNVVESTNTPFYKYLRSNTASSHSIDVVQKMDSICSNVENNFSTPVKETTRFGTVSPRPTLLHIYEGLTPNREKRTVCEDMDDIRDILFPDETTIQARKGSWLLYEEQGYRGSCILLEEGQIIRTSGRTRSRNTPSLSALFLVGSVKRAVKDDMMPEIHIYSACTKTSGPLCFYSETSNVGAYGSVHLSDLRVLSGCWLAYEGAGFTGNQTVLEVGGLTTPIIQSALIPSVGSLRPIRMEGPKVWRPLDPKILVYEKPLFQGQHRELVENTPSLSSVAGPVRVFSLRVTGGVWVGYSCENYRGQQCVLEEGEYRDCSALFSGTEDTLKSFRFIQANFVEPALSLKSYGEQMELVDQDVVDLQQNEQELEINTIIVVRGVWVAYSGKYYSGEQYVLEKGQHSGSLDWGGRKSSPQSIRPIRKEICGEKEPTFLLRAYSKPHFAGESREFEDEVADFGMLGPGSFRVIQGSWLLYDEKSFRGNSIVLEEGLYPTLASCGCMATAIRSIRPIHYNFSEPSISLFSLSSFEGMETAVNSNIDAMENFFTQSLRVNSGLWVAYEYGQFKGRQMLLQPGEYPCWWKFSGWETVGSLHPLRQQVVYIQVWCRALGMALTAERTGERSTPAKLSLSPADRLLHTQHWMYTDGLLKSKVGKGCLTVIGGKAGVGNRVALWEEHGRVHQRWRLNKNKTISTHLNNSLVLERKGGSGLDKDHLILNEFCADSITQIWEVEVL